MTLTGSTASKTRSQVSDSDGEWESLTEGASEALIQKAESLEIVRQMSIDALCSGDFPQDEETDPTKPTGRSPCFEDPESEMRFKDALIRELHKTNHTLRLKIAEAENKILELKLRIQNQSDCGCKTLEVGEDFADCHDRQTYYGNPVSDSYRGLGSRSKGISRRNKNSSESLVRTFEGSQLATKKAEEKFVPFVKVKRWQNASESLSSVNFEDIDEERSVGGLPFRAQSSFRQFSRSEYESNSRRGMIGNRAGESRGLKPSEKFLFRSEFHLKRDIGMRSSEDHNVNPYLEMMEDQNRSSYETVPGMPSPVDSFAPMFEPTRVMNSHSQTADFNSTINRRQRLIESTSVKPGVGIVGQLMNLANSRFTK